ncbi:hypothetical protein FLAG1_06620 [Fusarium langsethiae]|uniref:Uncharacterized protein n=1 Tax=Fusarium langsethiae TaxID=179993 RepID=A0A0M9EV19_FUSLA|nr:hypothetical protein FLAG1_06620 [Fusarium langsethiae]GKU04088.1 unnamed protein product [Fusarium langsethiae]
MTYDTTTRAMYGLAQPDSDASVADTREPVDPLPGPQPLRQNVNPAPSFEARGQDRRQDNIIVQLYDLEAQDMFGAAELEIEDDPARDYAVTQWAGMMHALCVVLDNERGLGCSDMLLAEILDFFESLIRDVHDILGWDETTILFEAFAGIFRTGRPDLMRQVCRIWKRFDPEVQDQLLRDMRRALPVEGIDGMAHRMYRALGY